MKISRSRLAGLVFAVFAIASSCTPQDEGAADEASVSDSVNNAPSARCVDPTGCGIQQQDQLNKLERLQRDSFAIASIQIASAVADPVEPEVNDAGSPEVVDAGSPPVIDPGTPTVDAGTPAVDAGAPPTEPADGWTSIPQGTRRATFPRGQTGPGTTGAAFTLNIPAARVYHVKYEVMPEGNFDFRAGGKLPGLGGGSTPAGGSQATDGYSARLMWNEGGRLSFYFYRVVGGVGGIDTGGSGTHWMWAADANLEPGQWNTIEIAIDMNTGETIGYLNGVEKARQSLSYQWNTTDKIVFSAFFGGQGAAYEPSKNEAMSFRNMSVKAGN